jgi:hypothetical protein
MGRDGGSAGSAAVAGASIAGGSGHGSVIDRGGGRTRKSRP